MSKPNKTAAAYYAKRGRKPEAVEAADRRFAESELAKDIAAFQAGTMTAEAFKAKWDK